MLLLIMCCDLEVADRGMTTAITRVLAQTFGASSTSLARQLMGNRVRHRGPLAQRGPSALGLHLSAPWLLERRIFTDVQASALPARGCRALGAQGTPVTRRRRTLGLLAWDQGDGWSTGTGPLQSCTVHEERLLGEKRTNVWPGAREKGHALLCPLGAPRAGHGAQVASERQQAWSVLQRLGQQLHRFLLGLVRRTDHHLSGDCALQIHGTGLLEAVEGCGAALAAVAHGFLLDGEAPVKRDVRRAAPPPRPSRRIWCRLLREHRGDGLQNRLDRRCLDRQGVVLLQPVWPSRHLLQDQPQRLC